MEGTPASVLIQLMKKHGYNVDLRVEVGRVVAVSPALSLLLPKDNLTLAESDCLFAQSALAAPFTVGDLLIILSDEPSGTFVVLDKLGVL